MIDDSDEEERDEDQPDDIPLNIAGHEDREPPDGSDAADLFGASDDGDESETTSEAESTAPEDPESESEFESDGTTNPTKTTRTSNRSRCSSSWPTRAKSTRGTSTSCG